MEWTNPRYEATVVMLRGGRAPEAADRGKRCRSCWGDRRRFLIGPDGVHYSVPCLWCGGSGLRPARRR